MCLHILTHIVLISALALMTPVAPPTAFVCRTMSIFCLPKFISQPATNAHICGFDCKQRTETTLGTGRGVGRVGQGGRGTWRPAQFLTPCRDAADYCHDKFQRLKPSGGGMDCDRIEIPWARHRHSERETEEGQRQQQEYDLTRPLGILHRLSVTHIRPFRKIDSPTRNL